MHMPFLRHTLKRALWTWTQMPSAPCWKDAEQRKANQRLGSRNPHSISCERREWEKGRWFCAITGKPVLVLYCLCWGFGVLKKSVLAATGRNRNSQCKTHQHPKMWRGCDVESRICLITKLNPLQDSQQWFLQEQKGKLGCLVLRIWNICMLRTDSPQSVIWIFCNLS